MGCSRRRCLGYRTIPGHIRKYIDTYAVGRRWWLSPGSIKGIDNIVVIPSLAESQRLFTTLSHLSKNDAAEKQRTMVICVINNRGVQSTPPEDIEDNRTTLAILRNLVDGKVSRPSSVNAHIADSCRNIIQNNLKVAYVDASSPGCEMPERFGGVGLARRIGLDLALQAFDYEGGERNLLVSLDADTIVEDAYLGAIRNFFARSKCEAAVVEFNHQDAATAVEQAAICCYELFLRYYVLGLGYARSPYAFHAIGSTMVCTADGYAAVRGMNRRRAGEDFYFLNKLAKLRGIGRIGATRVYPSSRESHRVPFGTGRRITRFLDGDSPEYVVYDQRIFEVLKRWLACVSEEPQSSGDILLGRADDIHPELATFLRKKHFTEVWSRLQSNTNNTLRLLRHFHQWFDGFKTLMLIHHLTRTAMPRVKMFDALGELFVMVERKCPVRAEAGAIPSLQQQMQILDHIRHVERAMFNAL